jgi:hypothetical protein
LLRGGVCLGVVRSSLVERCCSRERVYDVDDDLGRALLPGLLGARLGALSGRSARCQGVPPLSEVAASAKVHGFVAVQPV